MFCYIVVIQLLYHKHLFLYKYAFSLKYAANVSDSLMCNQGFESRWMSVELVCYVKIIIILLCILRLLL